MLSPRLRKLVRAATALLLGADVAYLVAFKAGKVPYRPETLAILAGATALAAAVWAVDAAVRCARGPRRVGAAAEVAIAGGLLAMLLAGLANWAWSFEGFVVVAEREPARLDRPSDVPDLRKGPLADPRELALTVGLAKLQLVGAGPEHFRAVSRLKVLAADGEEVGVSLERGVAARFRNVMFRQGAFGFAPRVVVLQGDRVALDEDVPFRTVREGPQGIAFVRDFEIEKEKLTVRAVLTLEDLNDEMKGHPRLEMRVERDGKPFAVGTLKPGEFAAAPEDYRLGFAGLKRWSEIDFSRRTYDLPVRIALGVMVAGLLLWPVAAWRRW